MTLFFFFFLLKGGFCNKTANSGLRIALSKRVYHAAQRDPDNCLRARGVIEVKAITEVPSTTINI